MLQENVRGCKRPGGPTRACDGRTVIATELWLERKSRRDELRPSIRARPYGIHGITFSPFPIITHFFFFNGRLSKTRVPWATEVEKVIVEGMMASHSPG